MSYTMTHLILANQYRLRKRIPIQESQLFLLANISPDAVHANPNFTPNQKERSHLFPKELTWGNISKEAQMDTWYQNIKNFYQSRHAMGLTSQEEAFLNGYVMHLVVDIFNCSIVYAPNLIRYGHDVAKFRKDYREQCLRQDYFLYQNFGQAKELFQDLDSGIALLEKSTILTKLCLDKELNVDMIRNSVANAKKNYEMLNDVKLDDSDMITEELTWYFVQEIGKRCDELLFDLPEQKHMFKVNEY